MATRRTDLNAPGVAPHANVAKQAVASQPIVNSILSVVAAPGPSSTFHTLIVAAVATSAGILATAGQLGPVAPVLIAAGIYLLFFALVAELVFWSRRGVAALVRWRLRHVLQRTGQA